jgi:hypothetical protein
VGAGRGGFEPGQQAGEGRLGQGQVYGGASAKLAFGHDPARPEDAHLLLGGRAVRHHGQVAAGEGLLGAHREPEDAVPAELVELVGGEAQAPRAARPAQAALDRGAVPLEHEPASRDARGGHHEQDQEGGEEPGRVERQRFGQP